MTFLTPAALIGLVLVPLVVLLYVRRPRPRQATTSSLLLWRGLEGVARARRRSWRVPLLMLILQVLAITLLVLGLARPAGTMRAPAVATRVVVLDDSLDMTIRSEGRTQFSWARQILASQLARAPLVHVTVILAAAQGRVLLSDAPDVTVLRMVARLQPEMAPPDFTDAFRLAAGFAAPHMPPILVIHALQDMPPRFPGYTITSIAVGQSRDDQLLERFTVACTDGQTVCAGLATALNRAPFPVQDRVAILADGDLLGVRALPLGAHAQAEISFPVPAGQHVIEIQLQRPDILLADNTAWSVVPGAQPATVTIVGQGGEVSQLARAVSGISSVRVRVVSPGNYERSRMPWSDLLILDGWSSVTSMPAAGAVVFVNPPQLPGLGSAAPMADTTLTGEDTTNPLLSGVDLTSLDVPAGDAEQLPLPPSVSPLVWSASGPLLAAGTLEGERVAVLAFAPNHSDLAQLPAYPVLMANLVNWAGSWVPSEASVGSAVTIQSIPRTKAVSVSGPALRQSAMPGAPFTPREPGIYRVVERGTWGTREAEFAANLTYPESTSLVDTPSGAVASVPPETSVSWWMWMGLAALVLIVAEMLVSFSPRAGR